MEKLFKNLTYDEALYVIRHPECPGLLTEAARNILAPYKETIKTKLEEEFEEGIISALVTYLNLEGIVEPMVYKNRGNADYSGFFTFANLEIYWVPRRSHIDVIGLSDEMFWSLKSILNNI